MNDLPNEGDYILEKTNRARKIISVLSQMQLTPAVVKLLKDAEGELEAVVHKLTES